MGVKTVFIPVSFSMKSEAAFLARATGEMDKYQMQLAEAKTQAEAELDDLLHEGYEVVCSHMLDAGNQTQVVIVLHQQDGRRQRL